MIGEYIFIGEDAPGGNIVVGISSQQTTGPYDHINLFKILPQADGTLKWFDYEMEAATTILEPSLGTVDDILETRGQAVSASYHNGNFMWMRGGQTKNVPTCGAD